MSETLKKLADKFPPQDIEWRVLRSMPWGSNIRCLVYPYVTARAIHQRLDDVVGPENWCNTEQIVSSVDTRNDGRSILSVQVGIRIRMPDGSWVTKYNVSEATDIEPAKGAFSGAEKRAGEEWGIGRYLWFLGEMDADTSKTEKPGWTYGQLAEKYGREKFWWNPPRLPAWALPPAGDDSVSQEQLNELKTYWAKKLASTEKNRSKLAERFSQLVVSMFGACPVDYASGWTPEMLEQVRKRIDEDAKKPNGPSSDVPFDP